MLKNPATSFVPCIAPPHPTYPSPSVSLRRQKRYSNAISLLKSLSGLSLLTLSHPLFRCYDGFLGIDFGFMGFSLNEFNGFLRSDFDEGLMGFWGLILVYGFLNFFFFVLNLWVSHWTGFNGFLEFDSDQVEFVWRIWVGWRNWWLWVWTICAICGVWRKFWWWFGRDFVAVAVVFVVS